MKTYGENLQKIYRPEEQAKDIPKAVVINNDSTDYFGCPLRQPRIDQPRVKLPQRDE